MRRSRHVTFITKEQAFGRLLSGTHDSSGKPGALDPRPRLSRAPRLDSCEVRSVLTEMAASTLRARTVNIWLYDQGTRCYLSTSSRMEARFRKVPASHRLLESMLSSGDPFNFADAGDEGEIADFAFFTGSIVCAPLIASRELVGFMTVGPQTNGVAYSESDVKLLIAFATQPAV